MSTLIRSALVVFLAGWIAWFTLDKHTPDYYVRRRPPPAEDLIQGLQFGANLLKAGRLGPAFAHLWHNHYLLLSLAGGGVVVLVVPALARVGQRLPQTRRTGARDRPSSRSDDA